MERSAVKCDKNAAVNLLLSWFQKRYISAQMAIKQPPFQPGMVLAVYSYPSNSSACLPIYYPIVVPEGLPEGV